MLEMLIAVVLVGMCALPLAQIPMRALQQEYHSAYRLQAQRLADLAFADIKERLYKKEIPWKQIINPSDKKATVLEDTVEVAIEPLGTRKFIRRGTLHSVGKKNKKGEECRLATIQITIMPVEKKLRLFRGKKHPQRSCSFNYQLPLSKTSASVIPSGTPDPLPLPKEGEEEVVAPPTPRPKKKTR